MRNPTPKTTTCIYQEADILAASAYWTGAVARDPAKYGLQCKFAYWPGRQMACRDDGYLNFFGADR
eukprot:7206811-Heterocapsa_arctica.AAC.1